MRASGSRSDRASLIPLSPLTFPQILTCDLDRN